MFSIIMCLLLLEQWVYAQSDYETLEDSEILQVSLEDKEVAWLDTDLLSSLKAVEVLL